MQIIVHALMALILFTGSLLTAAQAQDNPESKVKVRYEEQQLELDFSGLQDFKTLEDESQGQLQGRWAGKIGDTKLTVNLFFLGAKKFRFSEPRDVLNIMELNLDPPRGSKNKDIKLSFLETEVIEGPYGYVPVAWLGIHGIQKGTRITQHEIHFCGLTQKAGYSIEVQTSKALNPQDRPAILEWLKSCAKYDGPTRNALWSEEEVEKRWERDAPPKVQEKSKLTILRTEYYLIMTNVGKGTTKSFGEKLDENYEIIRSVYPFEDVPAQRLLPIFYFITPTQYHDWCEVTLKDRMASSAGVAFGDVYATYHQSSGAPVHIHEATHQIFKNRLFLGGGGSWFQEGVAEYMSEKPGDLSSIKGLVKRDRHKPFKEFFKLKSLLGDAKDDVKGGSDAGNSYTQAAAIIEFARHSKFGSEKFLEFVHAIGAVPRSNMAAIEKGLLKVYQVDIAGFEEEFKKYWLKRKKRKKLKKAKKSREK
ncbi:MAG: hypothetical protein ACI87O_000231 [Planctomycetota bacterium]|jgi:hypothetical protein